VIYEDIGRRGRITLEESPGSLRYLRA